MQQCHVDCEHTLTNFRRMLYREIKSSSQRSGGNGRSRLASYDPKTTTTNSTNHENRKSKAFGFSAKYGRDAASILSAESQEALKDVEHSATERSAGAGGIMKTEEFSVRQEAIHGSEDEDSVEMVSLGHGRATPYDRR